MRTKEELINILTILRKHMIYTLGFYPRDWIEMEKIDTSDTDYKIIKKWIDDTRCKNENNRRIRKDD